MRVEKLVGERFKERPSDCVVDSHALMLRGGYMKYVANGIFSMYTPLRRVARKIEQIIREEMDAIDGQEVLFPVALPATLWEESGRFESVGEELLRFTDRNGAKMVLGMTHEEAAVQLVREWGQSHTRYPFMIYQIQTKFRDEARPRGGLIRVREFTMKDAYSFHTSQADLEKYYHRCYDAYLRIFARAGIPEVVTVQSDSGMMGGSISHEYMLLTAVGEDSIVLCDSCDFRANMEAADHIPEKLPEEAAQPLALVYTPGTKTIEAVCEYLSSSPMRSVKAVAYLGRTSGKVYVLFLRGDLEANETKLTRHLGEEIVPADLSEVPSVAAGFIGPVGLSPACVPLYDASLVGAVNFVCGANREDHHYTGFSFARDAANAPALDFAKAHTGGICPKCGKPTLTVSRGIEVGNIFQLGDKYTDVMGMRYLDEAGALQTPVMGCYGIGVGRLAASVVEARHDAYGPIWPLSIAPWQVHLCCVRADDAETRAVAEKMYEDLTAEGVEVLYDDRSVSAGVMFADADLFGLPYRVIVSPRNLKNGAVEIASRDKSMQQSVPVQDAAETIRKLVRA